MEAHSIWPAGSSAPEPLIRFLAYAERNQGQVVGDLRVSTELQPELLKWFQGDRKMARPFAVFGHWADHRLSAPSLVLAFFTACTLTWHLARHVGRVLGGISARRASVLVAAAETWRTHR